MTTKDRCRVLGIEAPSLDAVVDVEDEVGAGEGRVMDASWWVGAHGGDLG